MEFRTETEILYQLVQKADEIGLLSLNTGDIEKIRNGELSENQYILDLDTHAYLHSELERYTEEIYNNTNINTATGSALDDLGDLVNVTRPQSKPSICEIEISSPVELKNSITIPQGTEVNLIDICKDYGTYVTAEDVTLHEGVLSAKTIIQCVSGELGSLPLNAVEGLKGFSTLHVTNVTEGVGGTVIESDDLYRERIKKHAEINSIGSKECLTDFLDKYEGIHDYNLIPLYDGIGTLKIIVDTTESLLEQISQDVFTNCMLFTDKIPVVELPDKEHIGNLELEVTLIDSITLTADEIRQLIVSMCNIYVGGGVSRNGATIFGLSIGDSLSPALLLKFLLDEIPEIKNIDIKPSGIISCPANSRIVLDGVDVNFI